MSNLAHLVPKQRPLTDNETPTSFESWKESMCFTISLDKKAARFLDDLKTWRSSNVVNRGFVNDDNTVDADLKMTAIQKSMTLEHILGIVAGYAPVISHSYIKQSALSLEDIFNRLRSFYGFRRTGSRITELMELKMGSMESREALWERFYSFMEGNLLKPNGLTHEGAKLEDPELFTPTLLNTVVVLWLHAVHPLLPSMVKQRFSTNLRSQTIFSIRDEISDSIPSLIQELEERDSASISRANSFHSYKGNQRYQQSGQQSRGASKSFNSAGSKGGRSRRCALCYQAKRPDYHTHYMSRCPFLPADDKAYFSRIHDLAVVQEDEFYEEAEPEVPNTGCLSSVVDSEIDRSSGGIGRVDIVPSPELPVEVNGKTVVFSCDTGAESTCMKASKCKELGIRIEPTHQRANMADGDTPLETIGEFHHIVYRTCPLSGVKHALKFSGLAVKNLSCTVLAGMPFLETNDIYVRPKLRMIYIGDCCSVRYSNAKNHSSNSKIHRATILRSPKKLCLLPGESVSVPLPVPSISKEVALEPRYDAPSSKYDWLSCNILPMSSGAVVLENKTGNPILIGRQEQICQIRPTIEMSESSCAGE